MKKYLLGSLFLILYACSLQSFKLNVNSELEYCEMKVKKSLEILGDTTKMPRNILSKGDGREWNCTSIYDWTSGFWPGILWYVYEFSGDSRIKKQAERFSSALYPVLDRKPDNHDLGFMMYCSLGNAYRITKKEEYKKILLQAADSLATLYDERIGTIHSWPGMRQQQGWPHNTIIDNMLNLELLFWASKHGGGKHLYDMAYRHALVTAENQFRKDYSTCHVVIYDTISGKRLAQVTHQGYADSSMWARGQAWAIYGFTMCYRETGDKNFLKIAQNAADIYLRKLPSDGVPYWDFDAPDIPNEPKDASAAAIVASGLLELSSYLNEKNEKVKYFNEALKMLITLSSSSYQSRTVNDAFLLHSTGHKPNNSEVDASIIYADYYYIEALMRLKKIYNNQKVIE